MYFDKQIRRFSVEIKNKSHISTFKQTVFSKLLKRSSSVNITQDYVTLMKHKTIHFIDF